MPPPKVFISYSHDSAEHKAAVLGLADRLRREGVEVTLDQYLNATPPEGWPRWMANRIREADFVLVICTELYCGRFEGREEPGTGLGAQWEGLIVTQSIYEAAGNNDIFLPVLLRHEDVGHRPGPLRPATYYEIQTEQGYERLYRVITNQPAVIPPPVGEVRTLPPLARSALPNAIPWDAAWVVAQYEVATRELPAIGVPGFFIAKSALVDHRLNARLIEVREAAKRAGNVRTPYAGFVGRYYENNEAFRPRVLDREITATITGPDPGDHQHWAVRIDGYFYLLMNLLEDPWETVHGRAAGQTLDWVTRIIRVAEVLLYCGRFYRGLQVPIERHVQIAVTHSGLLNRHLVAEGAMFHHEIHRHTCRIRDYTHEIVVPLRILSPDLAVRAELVASVAGLLDPLFERFDLFTLENEIYAREVAKIANPMVGVPPERH